MTNPTSIPTMFGDLPNHAAPLPPEDAALLVSLPEWPTTTEVDQTDHPSCRRLERRGLLKVSREKMDPVAIQPTWFAGRLP